MIFNEFCSAPPLAALALVSRILILNPPLSLNVPIQKQQQSRSKVFVNGILIAVCLGTLYIRSFGQFGVAMFVTVVPFLHLSFMHRMRPPLSDLNYIKDVHKHY